jgi:hypothetical protein
LLGKNYSRAKTERGSEARRLGGGGGHRLGKAADDDPERRGHRPI